MLSKGDKEWLEKMMERKITEALTVRVKMERRRDMATGQPLAVPVIEEKDVYLPAFWVEYMPYYEGAMRGMQETVDKVNNRTTGTSQAVENIGRILVTSQDAIKRLVETSYALAEIAGNDASVKQLRGVTD
ncbi:MAG: hypothetical protein A4E65_02324 [Syntrophorhabdus sp. PtaU1.Bin153]|nr:MAG: hypothetical protein A4E65_02324 [Syntrophorhabdus sp. PtaU1.Bin153]